MQDDHGVYYNERTHHAPHVPKVDADGRKVVRIVGDMHEQGFRWGYEDSPLMDGESIYQTDEEAAAQEQVQEPVANGSAAAALGGFPAPTKPKAAK